LLRTGRDLKKGVEKGPDPRRDVRVNWRVCMAMGMRRRRAILDCPSVRTSEGMMSMGCRQREEDHRTGKRRLELFCKRGNIGNLF
jgi:hypothetical protein